MLIRAASKTGLDRQPANGLHNKKALTLKSVRAFLLRARCLNSLLAWGGIEKPQQRPTNQGFTKSKKIAAKVTAACLAGLPGRTTERWFRIRKRTSQNEKRTGINPFTTAARNPACAHVCTSEDFPDAETGASCTHKPDVLVQEPADEIKALRERSRRIEAFGPVQAGHAMRLHSLQTMLTRFISTLWAPRLMRCISVPKAQPGPAKSAISQAVR